MNPPRLGIIFCNTKRSVDECTEHLINRGYAADRLHGDMTQMMRERVLKRFRDGSVELLVATDVAARGLDIKDMPAVINFELPPDPEIYVRAALELGVLPHECLVIEDNEYGVRSATTAGCRVVRVSRVEQTRISLIDKALSDDGFIN
jgi:beta-phosphoglucomutase-like phosphatase (HAD superfamily)